MVGPGRAIRIHVEIGGKEERLLPVVVARIGVRLGSMWRATTLISQRAGDTAGAVGPKVAMAANRHTDTRRIDPTDC